MTFKVAINPSHITMLSPHVGEKTDTEPPCCSRKHVYNAKCAVHRKSEKEENRQTIGIPMIRRYFQTIKAPPFRVAFGRGRRFRTLGLRFWRPSLYQLSYSPIFLSRRSLIEQRRRDAWWTVRDSNPGPTGYEPVALPTELTVHIKRRRRTAQRRRFSWRPL